MKHDRDIEALYKQGIQPLLIADRLKLDVGYVRGRVQRMRHAGIITNYTRGKGDPNYVESTARQIYLQRHLKVGSISKLLDQMAPETQKYFVDRSINEGYETLSELLADVLVDHYYEQMGE